ncbi:MAG: pyoluteorin transport system ATP-binding protein, partial [Thermoplasmata archaeon]|nr:pyoluteorin transport system ATP-binding protein [Thermoplasmata archaeon]
MPVSCPVAATSASFRAAAGASARRRPTRGTRRDSLLLPLAFALLLAATGLLPPPSSAQAVGTLFGTVFSDPNGNALQDAGEEGLAGVTVYVDSNANAVYDPGDWQAATNATGVYSLTVPPGTFTLRQLVPAGFGQDSPSGGAGQTATGAVGERHGPYDFADTPGADSPPPAPTLTASAANGQVSLSWVVPAGSGSAITQFKVYRGIASGGEALRAIFDANTFGTVDGASNGQTYYYQVSAVNAAGEGPRSHERSARPSAGTTTTTSPAPATNQPPNTPSVPAGPTALATNQAGTYSSSAADPEGNEVQVVFDWGDGLFCWSSYAPSGSTATCGHAWGAPGSYCVRSYAKDGFGLQSQSSTYCLNVNVNSATVAPPTTSSVPNRAPDAPAAPTGQTFLAVDQPGEYATAGTDPDGDNVQVVFDWGDGTSCTTPFAGSGSRAACSHVWTDAGSYCVRAYGRDVHGVAGRFSDCTTVLVGNPGRTATASPSRTPSASFTGGRSLALMNAAIQASLAVARNGDTNVITWQEQPGAAGYQLWRSNSPWVLVSTSQGPRNHFDDIGAPPSSGYLVTAFTSEATRLTDVNHEEVPGLGVNPAGSRVAGAGSVQLPAAAWYTLGGLALALPLGVLGVQRVRRRLGQGSRAPAPAAPVPVGGTALALRDVAVTLGGKAIVQPVTLDVPRGQLTFLLGTSGSGKSTLLKAVMGLHAASGTFQLAGRPVKPGSREAMAQVGYVPQELQLYTNLTALGNIQYFGGQYGLSGAEAKARGLRLLAELGLEG